MSYSADEDTLNRKQARSVDPVMWPAWFPVPLSISAPLWISRNESQTVGVGKLSNGCCTRTVTFFLFATKHVTGKLLL